MNKRVRLAKHEATYLGLKTKKKSGLNNPIYTVSPEQLDSLRELRALGQNAILNESVRHGISPENVKHLWTKEGNSSVFIKNPLYSEPEVKTYFDLRDQIIKDLQKYSPTFPKIQRAKSQDSHCFVVDPADVHIGKLASLTETGNEYNSDMAVNRVLEGVDGLLHKSANFDIDKIVFIGGNDILHVDTPRSTTTAGTPQDTCDMWYDNFLRAKDLYVSVLEKLASVADVHFVFCPSNHDFQSGFFLADTIATYFRKCSNITFDVSLRHRKYMKYHDNLLGFTHGDGAKVNDLPMLMADESEHWSQCPRRYVYSHHVHHKFSKDLGRVAVESVRSPSGTDGWHHRNGFVSRKAVEGFIHCPRWGQVSRITHNF